MYQPVPGHSTGMGEIEGKVKNSVNGKENTWRIKY